MCGFSLSFSSGQEGLLYFIIDEEDPEFISPESYHQDFRFSYGRSIVIVFVLSNPQFFDPDISKSNYVRYNDIYIIACTIVCCVFCVN